MKKSRSAAEAFEPAKLFQGITSSAVQDNRLPDESNLSPERIRDGASDTTALVTQMLSQRQKLYQLRDWGINE